MSNLDQREEPAAERDSMTPHEHEFEDTRIEDERGCLASVRCDGPLCRDCASVAGDWRICVVCEMSETEVELAARDAARRAAR